MVERNVALEILQNVATVLDCNDKRNAKTTIDSYIKNLKIATNKNIQKLTNRYMVCQSKHGENDIRSKILAKKISEEMRIIYSKSIY